MNLVEKNVTGAGLNPQTWAYQYSAPHNSWSVDCPTATSCPSTVTTSSTGSYTASWTAVTGATTYTLQERVGTGSWATIQNTSARTKAISGKGNGSYGYRVQACNAGGCGAWSGIKTVAVALAPGMPTGAYIEYRITAKTETYQAHWNAVADATYYEAKRNDTGASVYSGTNTAYVIKTGLIPQLPDYYGFSVRACNDAGCSNWAVGE